MRVISKPDFMAPSHFTCRGGGLGRWTCGGWRVTDGGWGGNRRRLVGEPTVIGVSDAPWPRGNPQAVPYGVNLKVVPSPPRVVPHPLSFPGGGGGGSLGQPKIFRCSSLCCCVGGCVVGHYHLHPLHSWQDILLTFAEMELDNTTMFPSGTSVMFIRSTGEPVLAQVVGHSEECPWCVGHGTQFWEQVVFYKGHSRREMDSQKSACACQASYQEGKTTTQECCPKHSSGKW